MRQKWDDYEKAYERGPLHFLGKAFIGLIVISIPLGIYFTSCRAVNEATDVAHEQLGARALLKKYEWFKDASAMLDKKQADMKVYDSRLTSLKESYADKPRSAWAREDREQWNIWESEAAGVRASYNSLAAEYNSQMSKINWSFTNTGSLPTGASSPLPREYKPYSEQ